MTRTYSFTARGRVANESRIEKAVFKGEVVSHKESESDAFWDACDLAMYSIRRLSPTFYIPEHKIGGLSSQPGPDLRLLKSKSDPEPIAELV